MASAGGRPSRAERAHTLFLAISLSFENYLVNAFILPLEIPFIFIDNFKRKNSIDACA
jgi:hypothetical protein